MIHNVITAVALRLDEFIRNKLSLDEEAVIVSSLVDLKGNLNQNIENKITVFLLNIEEDKVSKNANTIKNVGLPPAVKVNIHLMFSAHFPNFNYIEALKYISLVIEFFQSNKTFSTNDTPEFPENVSKVNAELLNISIDEIGKLWGNIGTNYIPSVAYQLKHIHFDSNTMTKDIAKIIG